MLAYPVSQHRHATSFISSVLHYTWEHEGKGGAEVWLTHLCSRATSSGAECHVQSSMHTPRPAAFIPFKCISSVTDRCDSALCRHVSAAWEPACKSGQHTHARTHANTRTALDSMMPLTQIQPADTLQSNLTFQCGLHQTGCSAGIFKASWSLLDLLDIQVLRSWFVADTARRKTGSSKSKSLIIGWKMMDCALWAWGFSLQSTLYNQNVSGLQHGRCLNPRKQIMK